MFDYCETKPEAEPQQSLVLLTQHVPNLTQPSLNPKLGAKPKPPSAPGENSSPAQSI
ncbi:MAG: hypothetical protein AAB399_01075 [Patescibacteria group bacterium]